jgi:hypothetical protein
MCLLILEIYKRGVYDGVSLALSKNIAHYALHSGFLHYYLESLDWDNNVEFYYLKSVLLKRGVLWCQWHTVVPCIPIRLIQNSTSFSNKKNVNWWTFCMLYLFFLSVSKKIMYWVTSKISFLKQPVHFKSFKHKTAYYLFLRIRKVVNVMESYPHAKYC